MHKSAVPTHCSWSAVKTGINETDPCQFCLRWGLRTLISQLALSQSPWMSRSAASLLLMPQT